jgi:hypothetical protein
VNNSRINESSSKTKIKSNMNHKFIKLLSKSALGALVLALALPALQVHAAQVTSFSWQMSRVQASTNSSQIIKFVTTTGVDANGDTIVLTFSGGTLASEVANNFDFAVGDSGNCSTATFTDESLALTADGSNWGVDVTGQAVTFTPQTGDTIAAGRCILVEMGAAATSGATGAANTYTTPAAGAITLTISGVFGDSGIASQSVIADDTVDVTATVASTLNFTLNHTTAALGTLSSSTISTASGTMNADTNGTSGYKIYANGATLTSGGNSIDALGTSATASNPGSEQFGIKVGASGGSGTATSPYNTANYAYGNIATAATQIASASAPSASTTYTVTYMANVGSTTEAGTYSTAITLTAAGTF